MPILGVVEAGDEEDDGFADLLEDGVAHRVRQQVQPPRARQELSPSEEVEQKLRNKLTVQSVFPVCCEVSKVMFYNIPSAGGPILQLPSAQAGRRRRIL